MTQDNTQELFKQGMQLLAASTTIITSEHEGARAGMAATAVTSLAADPPSLLICTNRTARTFDYIMGSGRFAVNVVPDSLTDVVGAFSSKEDKEKQFQMAGTWDRAASGLPILKEAVASFECTVSEWTDAHTHRVFFGLVDAVHLNPDASALIYAQRGFYKLAPVAA